ncbi:MAG: ATP-binding cassette domain-containing protein [Alphaproteobacteria bacterium]|nr:MAG: ATP-binding cassette domain-containing protein [Alphaproteobacteria bacterium]
MKRTTQSQDARAAEAPQRAGNLDQLVHLYRFVRPYWPAVAGALVALSVAAGTVLVMGLGLRRLVDEGFASGDTALLDGALVALLGVIVVLAGATYARFYLVSWLGERVVGDIRQAVFGHVIGLSPGFFELTRTGEVLSRITTDTTLLQVLVGSTAPIALRNLLLLIGGVVMLAVTSAKLMAFVVLVVPLVVAPIVLIGRWVRRLSRTSQDRVADVGAHVEESLNAVRTIQAFCHEAIDRARFDERVEAAFTVAVRRVRVRAALTALVIVLVFGAVGTILWIGGHDVMAGSISAGELSAFVFYAVVVAGAAGAISEVVGELQRAAGASERLIDLLATKSDITAPARPVALPSPALGEVRFDDVTFHYPSRPDAPALVDFTLEIEPGEKVALVGPSGAGKTTVMQVLLRFYDPSSGRIMLDGVDLRDADPAEVRARMGLVPQDPVIFAANGWENIRYGRPEADDEEVRAAAEAAAAAEFLDQLPDGFDSYLGEKGVRLSGGQRQRIAIARAILRDPAVLLLDEATSALDAESERLVQGAIERLMADRTTIVIAHRLATVLKVGRIVVMDRGRIVASGSHEQLTEEGGLYARLAALQFDVDAISGADPRFDAKPEDDATATLS